MTFISVATILGSGDVETADHLRSTAEDEVSDRPSWGKCNSSLAWT